MNSTLVLLRKPENASKIYYIEDFANCLLMLNNKITSDCILNNCDTGEVIEIERKMKTGERKKLCPVVTKMYNNMMGDVDLSD